MGNVSSQVLVQHAMRQSLQARFAALTDDQKFNGHQAILHALYSLDSVATPACEKGCTNQQFNNALSVQIQMQTSGNPLVAPADTRLESFHQMPWKNNSGLNQNVRSRAVADFNESLEDLNLIGNLNILIIP